MRDYTDKGTQKLPLIKLAATSDPDGHKRPVERDWQSKRYIPDDAELWVEKGYGVGLNIAGTASLGVLDVDQSGSAADAVARWCGEMGALVCVTPAGGYHIYICRHIFPHGDGRYTLTTPVGSVAVEWYRGSAPRNMVLPVMGTPRAKLGGHVVWCNARPVGEAVTLATLLEWLSDASKVRLPSGASLDWGDSDAQEGTLRRLFGKSVGELTQDEVIARVRQAKQGERHNTLLRAGLVFRMRGWDLEKLRSVGYEIFAGDRNAKEEVDGIVRWVESAQVRPWSEVAEANVKRRTASFADLVESAFPEGVEWCAEGDEVFVLSDGHAIRGGEGLAAYLAAKDIPIATERARRFLLYIKHNFPHNRAARILKAYPEEFPFGFALGVRVDGRLLALVAGGGELILRDPRALGVFVEWGADYRTLDRSDLDNAQRLSGELLGMLGGFFVQSAHAAADVALLIAAAVMSKTVVFITGESGSGKTTLSQLLQYIINGRAATLSTEDKRDFSAVAAGNRVVGFEEVEGLPRNFWNDIKIFTTLGELAQRSLYTNKGITTISARNTFIFATTDIAGIPGDVLRRAVHFSPSIVRRPLPEDRFAAALREEAPRYVVGLMYLLRNWRQAYAGTGLFGMLTNDAAAPELPDWLAKANKADLTLAYHYMYRELRVSELEAKAAWEAAREGAALKALGVWGDIIAKAEDDPAFAERMRSGMVVADIAQALEVESRGLSSRLTANALKIAPVLLEMGWVLKIQDGQNKRRQRTKLYILYKHDERQEAPF